MEDKELHPVVELLLARMKSHPEEFNEGSIECYGRWESTLHVVYKHASEDEKLALDEGMRPIRLDNAHENMLDELLNGPERRRKEQEDREVYKGWHTMLGAGSVGSSAGQFVTDYDYSTQTMRIKDTHTGAVTTVSQDQLEDKGFAVIMKEALGI